MLEYNHLSPEDRDEIYVLRQKGFLMKDIAKEIGRDPSTISRELRRNKTMIGVRNNNSPRAKEDPKNYYYLPDRAQEKYLERRSGNKHRYPLKSPALYEYIIQGLRIGWGPELTAGRAKSEGIGKISHECIYQFIYSKEGRGLELYKYLPRAHKKRRSKIGRKGKRTLIPNRVGIEERPKAVESRLEFGHWESDSVVGVGKGAALNTNRERKTRRILITKIERKTAQNTRLAIIDKFKDLPLSARKTNTMDNGCEFTEHEKITEAIYTKIYFTNPYSSWERGTNENGNGLIRRFYPKQTDFNDISPEEIQAVEDWINNRPMKCLEYKTPNEAFQEELIALSLEKPKIALDG